VRNNVIALFSLLCVKQHLRDERTDKDTRLFVRLSVLSVRASILWGTKRDAS